MSGPRSPALLHRLTGTSLMLMVSLSLEQWVFDASLEERVPWMWQGLSKMSPHTFQPQGPLPPTALRLLSVDSEGSRGEEHLVLGTWLFLSFREQGRVCAAEDSLGI